MIVVLANKLVPQIPGSRLHPQRNLSTQMVRIGAIEDCQFPTKTFHLKSFLPGQPCMHGEGIIRYPQWQ